MLKVGIFGVKAVNEMDHSFTFGPQFLLSLNTESKLSSRFSYPYRI